MCKAAAVGLYKAAEDIMNKIEDADKIKGLTDEDLDRILFTGGNSRLLTSNGLSADTKTVKKRHTINTLIGSLLGGAAGTGVGLLMDDKEASLWATAIGTGLGYMGSSLTTNYRGMKNMRKDLRDALESGKVTLGDGDKLSLV